MKYKKFTGIILKKQNYKEADQIVTVYTKEQGKIRCLAKSLRLSKSKLAGSFQDLTRVKFEVTGGRNLPTLISAFSEKSYRRIREDLGKTAAALYATELVIKLTADEQANVAAYDLLSDFLFHLETASAGEQSMFGLLDSFALKFLALNGFSIQYAGENLRLPIATQKIISQLQTFEFADVVKIEASNPKQIHKSIQNFVEYILERNIKSHKFLTSI